MVTDLTRLVKELSRGEIEALLAAKNEMESLEGRRLELRKELAEVERKLEHLAGRMGAGKVASRAGKKAVKKTAKKSAKKSAGKTSRKTVKKASTKAAKASPKKAADKPAGRGRGRASGPGLTTLEDVVVKVLSDNGGPLSFKELLSIITTRKLFKSRSKSFDNVLRRTLSTSDKVKRVGRAVYGL